MGRPGPTGLNGRHDPEKWPTGRTMGRTLGPQHGGGPARSARGPTWPASCRAGPAGSGCGPYRPGPLYIYICSRLQGLAGTSTQQKSGSQSVPDSPRVVFCPVDAAFCTCVHACIQFDSSRRVPHRTAPHRTGTVATCEINRGLDAKLSISSATYLLRTNKYRPWTRMLSLDGSWNFKLHAFLLLGVPLP